MNFWKALVLWTVMNLATPLGAQAQDQITSHTSKEVELCITGSMKSWNSIEDATKECIAAEMRSNNFTCIQDFIAQWFSQSDALANCSMHPDLSLEQESSKYVCVQPQKREIKGNVSEMLDAFKEVEHIDHDHEGNQLFTPLSDDIIS